VVRALGRCLRGSRALVALSVCLFGCASEGLESDEVAAPSRGLPCEVDALLARHCQLCHGSGMRIGLMRLVTYEDLVAPAVTEPSLTTGQLALRRMISPDLPMPPSGARVPEAEIAAFRVWIEAGQPGTGCALPDEHGGR